MKPARYRYTTCCVEADGDDITAMVAAAKPVTLATFRRRCDTKAWEQRMGYAPGSLPTLESDYHMQNAFYKSTYRGAPCYYAVHSAIEYVFTPGAD